MTPVEVITAKDLAGALALLEEFLRDGEPVSEDFAERLRRAVQAGDLEVLAALAEDRIAGVLVLAYHLNVAASSCFASIEDLYVRPEARRRGVGRALLEAVDERCATRGISYVEVQVEDEAAKNFYATLGYEPEAAARVLSRSLAISH